MDVCGNALCEKITLFEKHFQTTLILDQNQRTLKKIFFFPKWINIVDIITHFEKKMGIMKIINPLFQKKKLSFKKESFYQF